MKQILEILSIIILIIVAIAGISIIINTNNETSVYAASNSSTSDLQLMARAINGEARGEPYEGQVAVRSSYIKPC